MIIHDIRQDTYGRIYAGRMHAALFDCDIDVVLFSCTEKMLAYAEQCAAYFNELPADLTKALTEYSLRYYRDMKRFRDPDDPNFPMDVSEINLREHITPRCLIIERPNDYRKLAFSLSLDCDWEPQHGLEWTINDGRILYVGDFMNISPWYHASVYQTDCISYVDDSFAR